MCNESHEYSYWGAGKWSESEKAPNQKQQRTKNWRIIKISHFVKLTCALVFTITFLKSISYLNLKLLFPVLTPVLIMGKILSRFYRVPSASTKNPSIAKHLLPDTAENNVYTRYIRWIQTSIIQHITHYNSLYWVLCLCDLGNGKRRWCMFSIYSSEYR